MHVLRYGAESRKPSQSIKIGNACNKIGSQCIKVGNECIKIWNGSFSALWDNFRHCETFSRNSFELFPRAPVRIFIKPADIYYACGYFITRAV